MSDRETRWGRELGDYCNNSSRPHIKTTWSASQNHWPTIWGVGDSPGLVPPGLTHAQKIIVIFFCGVLALNFGLSVRSSPFTSHSRIVDMGPLNGFPSPAGAMWSRRYQRHNGVGRTCPAGLWFCSPHSQTIFKAISTLHVCTWSWTWGILKL